MPLHSAIDGKVSPVTRDAIACFQAAFQGNGHRPLVVDGRLGRKTCEALDWAWAHRGRMGGIGLSPHFNSAELADHIYRTIAIKRKVIHAAEVTRHAFGDKPLGNFSAYRDPRRKVGAPGSKHKTGEALDPRPWYQQAALAKLKSLRVWTGIGYLPDRSAPGGKGPIRHLDVRDGDPKNPLEFPDPY